MKTFLFDRGPGYWKTRGWYKLWVFTGICFLTIPPVGLFILVFLGVLGYLDHKDWTTREMVRAIRHQEFAGDCDLEIGRLDTSLEKIYEETG